MKLTITSPAFEEGHTIPTKFTGDGANVSPPLAWTNSPDGTATFALICDDPDALRGTWVHWVLFNLPGNVRQLDEHVPTTATLANKAAQGKNDFGKR